ELQRWVRSYLGAKTAQTVTPTLAQTCGYAARFLYSTPAYYLWANQALLRENSEAKPEEPTVATAAITAP
ncbi:MAG: hypothetical protein GWP05_03315, partial [Anaerolineaceae bacterium]|nr:hypothetical protein [Anaerolineaceae bacterium]